MSKRKRSLHPGKRQALLMVLMGMALYIILPQIGGFRSSWSLLKEADPGLAVVAVIFTALTLAAGAGTYYFLAFRPLRYWRTLMVQLAATFVNRLLPAGIGALGANYLYLRHERHTAAQAVSVPAMNNLVGLTGHAILTVALLATFSGQTLAPDGWHGPHPASMLKWAVLAAVLLAATSMVLGRQRLSRALAGVAGQIASYAHRPRTLACALTTSLTLTLFNVLSLFFCAQALGIDLPLATVMLVFTIGLGAGSAVPTPGGLGGFEAGLAAGFVGYGVDPAAALAAALLYRLVSYWLPMAAGSAAFFVSERRGLFGT